MRISFNFQIVLMLLLGSAISTSVAQDKKPGRLFSKPPVLEQALEDSFEKDSRADYAIDDSVDSVDWSKGSMTLRDGAVVRRKIDASAWVEMDLDLEFPVLVKDGESSGLRIGIEIQGADDSFVWFRQKRENGKTRSAIFIAERNEKPKPVRMPLKFDTKLPNGNWIVSYRFGLWSVKTRFKSDVRILGYSDYSQNVVSCKKLVFNNDGAASKLRELTVRKLSSDYSNMEELHSDKKLAGIIVRMQNDAVRSYEQGDAVKAVGIAEETLPLTIKYYGKLHPNSIAMQGNLAALYTITGNNDAAINCCKNAIVNCKDLFGENHPKLALNFRRLGQLQIETGEFQSGVQSLERAIEVQLPIFGADHFKAYELQNDLAVALLNLGRFREGEEILRSVIKKHAQSVGKQNIFYAQATQNLAAQLAGRGALMEAEPLAQGAVQIFQEVDGKQHRRYAKSLLNFGQLQYRKEQYQDAIVTLHESLNILRETDGEMSPAAALAISELAVAYHDKGDLGNAAKFYLKALDIRGKTVGGFHPEYATGLGNLGTFYMGIGDYKKANVYLNRSVALKKILFGDIHPKYFESLAQLGSLDLALKNYSGARKKFAQASKINNESGINNPLFASAMDANIARCCRMEGKYKDALKYRQLVKKFDREMYGIQSRSYLLSVVSEGQLHRLMGELQKAESSFLQSSRLLRSYIDQNAIVQSEIEQRRAVSAAIGALHFYLHLGIQNKTPASQLYENCLNWKGLTVARQRCIRNLAIDSKNKSDFEMLTKLSEQIAGLLNSPPERPNEFENKKATVIYSQKLEYWRSAIDNFQNQKSEIEKRLSSNVREFRSVMNDTSLKDLVVSLPSDSVLVDYFKYKASTPNRHQLGEFQSEDRYVGFVVHQDASVQVVELGAAIVIDDLIEQWRKVLSSGDSSQSQLSELGDRIKKIVWTPLQPHLKAKETVLLSPDGALAKIPFSALPGDTSSEFLMEKYTFSNVSAPRMLPEMVSLNKRKEGAIQSMLLVGNVDYGGGNPNENRLRKEEGENRRTWSALPGTKIEMESIKSVYQDFGNGRVSVFSNDKATTKRFLTELPKNNFAHIATHGFFRPNQVKKGIAKTSLQGHGSLSEGFNFDFLDVSPGLQSGLVFAIGPESSEDEQSGNVTAEQISFLDLKRVELVVLSACETGIGEALAGDAMLSLQRSLEVAGVKSSLTSLWKVDDMATQQLMVRFYHNLLEKKMSRSQAIREAKLWLLKNPESIELVNKNRGEPVKVDPKKIIQPRKTDPSETFRAHPKYWAAFILDGDWR